MTGMLFTAAMPFLRKGVDSMKESEFIMALSMDLNWFKPESARAFVKKAVDSGILAREQGILAPTFDIKEVQVPMGFKPDEGLFEEPDVFEQIIERIMANTGDDKHKIVAAINRKRDETGGLFNIEVLGILVARELGIEVDDLIRKAYQNLLKQRTLPSKDPVKRG